jgi:hypothetical protein
VLLILLDDVFMCRKDVLFQRQICCKMRSRRLDTHILRHAHTPTLHILVPEIGTLYMTRNYDDADDDQELYIPRNAAAAAALS